MRILKLSFKNINSLSGEHEIDFTQPFFTDNGLFAITGKTGAGKSSILDAIALALFGKTPRVEITGNENAVMTRGERDCYSEIMFEVAGKKWTSAWKQEKTRPTAKNPEGSLKPVSRQIADFSKRIVADQVRSCDTKIVEILGLTFEQFTKVILLAQGSFAAFLQADKNDKGELLEQITGTEIYGEISRKIFERNKIEKEKLDKIQIELGAIKILDEEEIAKLNNQIVDFEKDKKQIEEELEKIEAAKKWLSDLETLQKQIHEAQQNLPELTEKAEKAKIALEQSEMKLKIIREEQAKQIPIFLKARTLDTQIAEQEKHIQPLMRSISEWEENKKAIAKKLKEQKTALEQSQKLYEEKQKWASENKKFEELVGNYLSIESQNLQVAGLRQELDEKNAASETAKKDLQEKKSNFQQAQKHFTAKNEALKAKIREFEVQKTKFSMLLNGKQISDYQLEKDKITAFGNQIKNLIDITQAADQNKTEIVNLIKQIEVYQKSETALLTKIAKAKKEYENIDNQIILLDENIKFAKTILSLDEHRKQLKDGEICPLCGALEHPFALGNIPQMDEKETILQKLKRDFKKLSQEIRQDEETLAKTLSDKGNTLKNKAKEEKTQEKNRAKQKEIVLELHKIQPDFKISEDGLSVGKLETVRIQKLEEYRLLNDQISMTTACEFTLSQLRDTEIPALQEETQKAATAKNDAETALKLAEQQQKTQQDLTNGAQEKYQTENEKLLQKLKNYGVENMQALKKCLDDWNENQHEITNYELKITELDSFILLNNNELKNIINTFNEKQTEKQNIETEKQKLEGERKEIFGEKSVEEEENRFKKQLETAETAKTKAAQDNLDANMKFAENQAVISGKEKELSTQKEMKMTSKTWEEIFVELEVNKMKSDEILQKIGANRQTLSVNEENLKNSGNKFNEKEIQQKKCNRWSALNELLGSADGKKYRNFAQALTFEHLIGLANRQLQKMSERYILKRVGDVSNPFELSVIDKFQNAEERTAKNLSGGEKFIVSLALALGLSNMASKNMRIDTMFIDEGFGTLDSDYLDTALSALSNLQNENKLIGVISHLAELKERIATHIEVVPNGRGHSKIEIR